MSEAPKVKVDKDWSVSTHTEDAGRKLAKDKGSASMEHGSVSLGHGSKAPLAVMMREKSSKPALAGEVAVRMPTATPREAMAELDGVLDGFNRLTGTASPLQVSEFDRAQTHADHVTLDVGGINPKRLAPSGRPLVKVEISRGLASQNLRLRETDDAGTTTTRYQLAQGNASGEKALFARSVGLGQKFPGHRFEYDKSASPTDPSHINWDVEMTTPDTVACYRDSVYPSIAGVVKGLVDGGVIPKKATIFDVGCGRGDLSAKLHAELPKARIRGGEFNGPSLKHARDRWEKHDKNQPQFFPMNAVEGLRDAAREHGIQPDVMVMSGFIARKIFDPSLCKNKALKTEQDCGREVMRQAFDVLKPGGVIVMAQKTDNLFGAEDFKAMGFNVLNTWDPAHDRACYVLQKPAD
jgi:SAM-dependent methyltransferase